MAVTDCATEYTLQFVLAALPAGASRILEIGCGEGALAAALAMAGLSVTAVDADPAAVEAAQARGVAAHHAEWPDFSDGLFDAVLFTRSLHHVADLGESLDAAGSALGKGGRVIIEDFLAEGPTERDAAWFGSLTATMDQAGLLIRPTPYLLHVLGRADAAHDDHDHRLHASAAIEAALRQRFGTVRAGPAAYHFRYLLPGVDEALGRGLLAHEEALIAAGVIEALGRRYVAQL